VELHAARRIAFATAIERGLRFMSGTPRVN
jgi:hypothetical protein